MDNFFSIASVILTDTPQGGHIKHLGLCLASKFCIFAGMASEIISILNHKGGVGKTTTTLNLGAALAKEGKNTLVVDLDPQNNLTQGLGKEFPAVSINESLVNGKPLPIEPIVDHLSLVPSDLDLAVGEEKLRSDVNGYFKLKKALQAVTHQFDFILIDCPPNLGILPLNALIASHSAIIVVQAHYFSVKGLQTVYDLVSDVAENLNPGVFVKGLLLTQVTNTVINKTIIDTVREGYKTTVFNTSIRQNVSLVESSYNNQDIFSYAPKSNGAEDYQQLALELISLNTKEHGQEIRVEN